MTPPRRRAAEDDPFAAPRVRRADVTARDPGFPPGTDMDAAAALARSCSLCADRLPLGPRPICQLHADARILVTSQAPGTKAHFSGIPFDDASGERLRDWLGMDRETFWNPTKLAILPMAMCYPGRLPSGGDAPPCRDCAPTWHPRILPLFRDLRLRLLVGSFAVRHVLGPKPGLAERVRDFRATLPRVFPLPHPSWRTLVWAKRNPWFEAEVIPALRREVARALR